MKLLYQLLTPKQFQVAGLVRYGLSNPQIAPTLKISEWSVHAHLSRIYERAGCDNRTMLAVRYALENQSAEKTPHQRAA